MNWRRGFIRLGIAFALAWIICVGYLEGTRLCANWEPVAMSYGQVKNAGGLVCFGAANFSPDWKTTPHAVITVLLPPIAMLLLGLAGLRIGRNFRSASK